MEEKALQEDIERLLSLGTKATNRDYAQMRSVPLTTLVQHLQPYLTSTSSSTSGSVKKQQQPIDNTNSNKTLTLAIFILGRSCVQSWMEQAATASPQSSVLSNTTTGSSPLVCEPRSDMNREIFRVLQNYFVAFLDVPTTMDIALESLALLILTYGQNFLCNEDSVREVVEFLNKVSIPSMLTSTKKHAYQIISFLLSEEHIQQYCISMGPTFLRFFMSAMDGERNPELVLILFQCHGKISSSFPAEHFSFLGEDFFEMAASYFPVLFTPPPNCPVTKDELRNALHETLANICFHEFCIPFVSSKLTSPSLFTKLDCMELLEKILLSGNHDSAKKANEKQQEDRNKNKRKEIIRLLEPHLSELVATIRSEFLKAAAYMEQNPEAKILLQRMLHFLGVLGEGLIVGFYIPPTSMSSSSSSSPSTMVLSFLNPILTAVISTLETSSSAGQSYALMLEGLSTQSLTLAMLIFQYLLPYLQAILTGNSSMMMHRPSSHPAEGGSRVSLNPQHSTQETSRKIGNAILMLSALLSGMEQCLCGHQRDCEDEDPPKKESLSHNTLEENDEVHEEKGKSQAAILQQLCGPLQLVLQALKPHLQMVLEGMSILSPNAQQALFTSVCPYFLFYQEIRRMTPQEGGGNEKEVQNHLLSTEDASFIFSAYQQCLCNPTVDDALATISTQCLLTISSLPFSVSKFDDLLLTKYFNQGKSEATEKNNDSSKKKGGSNIIQEKNLGIKSRIVPRLVSFFGELGQLACNSSSGSRQGGDNNEETLDERENAAGEGCTAVFHSCLSNLRILLFVQQEEQNLELFQQVKAALLSLLNASVAVVRDSNSFCRIPYLINEYKIILKEWSSYLAKMFNNGVASTINPSLKASSAQGRRNKYQDPTTITDTTAKKSNNNENLVFGNFSCLLIFDCFEIAISFLALAGRLSALNVNTLFTDFTHSQFDNLHQQQAAVAENVQNQKGNESYLAPSSSSFSFSLFDLISRAETEIIQAELSMYVLICALPPSATLMQSLRHGSENMTIQTKKSVEEHQHKSRKTDDEKEEKLFQFLCQLFQHRISSILNLPKATRSATTTSTTILLQLLGCFHVPEALAAFVNKIGSAEHIVALTDFQSNKNVSMTEEGKEKQGESSTTTSSNNNQQRQRSSLMSSFALELVGAVGKGLLSCGNKVEAEIWIQYLLQGFVPSSSEETSTIIENQLMDDNNQRQIAAHAYGSIMKDFPSLMGIVQQDSWREIFFQEALKALLLLAFSSSSSLSAKNDMMEEEYMHENEEGDPIVLSALQSMIQSASTHLLESIDTTPLFELISQSLMKKEQQKNKIQKREERKEEEAAAAGKIVVLKILSILHAKGKSFAEEVYAFLVCKPGLFEILAEVGSRHPEGAASKSVHDRIAPCDMHLRESCLLILVGFVKEYVEKKLQSPSSSSCDALQSVIPFVKKEVLKKSKPALDDPKRIVRRAAAACQHHWSLIK